MGWLGRLWHRVDERFRIKAHFEPFLRIMSGAFLYEALDERLTFSEALEKALRKPVPPHAFAATLCLGGMSTLLFFNQLVTGVLLTFYYNPSPEGAFESVRYISNTIPFGWLIRQMHAWGAHLMVIFVTLHMLKVFFNKAYRAPRELTWVAGALLFFLTLTFCFTGYLLPWDQLSYWATTVGTEMARGIPFIGDRLLVILRGGGGVSGVTLSRFYTAHTIVLPWVMGGLMIVHFALIRRLGISEPL